MPLSVRDDEDAMECRETPPGEIRTQKKVHSPWSAPQDRRKRNKNGAGSGAESAEDIEFASPPKRMHGLQSPSSRSPFALSRLGDRESSWLLADPPPDIRSEASSPPAEGERSGSGPFGIRALRFCRKGPGGERCGSAETSRGGLDDPLFPEASFSDGGPFSSAQASGPSSPGRHSSSSSDHFAEGWEAARERCERRGTASSLLAPQAPGPPPGNHPRESSPAPRGWFRRKGFFSPSRGLPKSPLSATRARSSFSPFAPKSPRRGEAAQSSTARIEEPPSGGADGGRLALDAASAPSPRSPQLRSHPHGVSSPHAPPSKPSSPLSPRSWASPLSGRGRRLIPSARAALASLRAGVHWGGGSARDEMLRELTAGGLSSGGPGHVPAPDDLPVPDDLPALSPCTPDDLSAPDDLPALSPCTPDDLSAPDDLPALSPRAPSASLLAEGRGREASTRGATGEKGERGAYAPSYPVAASTPGSSAAFPIAGGSPAPTPLPSAPTPPAPTLPAPTPLPSAGTPLGCGKRSVPGSARSTATHVDETDIRILGAKTHDDRAVSARMAATTPPNPAGTPLVARRGSRQSCFACVSPFRDAQRGKQACGGGGNDDDEDEDRELFRCAEAGAGAFMDVEGASPAPRERGAGHADENATGNLSGFAHGAPVGAKGATELAALPIFRQPPVAASPTFCQPQLAVPPTSRLPPAAPPSYPASRPSRLCLSDPASASPTALGAEQNAERLLSSRQAATSGQDANAAMETPGGRRASGEGLFRSPRPDALPPGFAPSPHGARHPSASPSADSPSSAFRTPTASRLGARGPIPDAPTGVPQAYLCSRWVAREDDDSSSSDDDSLAVAGGGPWGRGSRPRRGAGVAGITLMRNAGVGEENDEDEDDEDDDWAIRVGDCRGASTRDAALGGGAEVVDPDGAAGVPAVSPDEDFVLSTDPSFDPLRRLTLCDENEDEDEGAGGAEGAGGDVGRLRARDSFCSLARCRDDVGVSLFVPDAADPFAPLRRPLGHRLADEAPTSPSASKPYTATLHAPAAHLPFAHHPASPLTHRSSGRAERARERRGFARPPPRAWTGQAEGLEEADWARARAGGAGARGGSAETAAFSRLQPLALLDALRAGAYRDAPPTPRALDACLRELCRASPTRHPKDVEEMVAEVCALSKVKPTASVLRKLDQLWAAHEQLTAE